MSAFLVLWVFLQLTIGFSLVLPFVLYLLHFFRAKQGPLPPVASENDYAIIVTAYQQTTLIPSVVGSILNLNYKKYIVYIVADDCDTSELKFNDDHIVLLKPSEVLASNTKSHFFAIRNFNRPHSHLTIIDSDNLVEPDYLTELDKYFKLGFIAVQGVRKAKNLNSAYACLDEAGDMYYRYTDRKLLFEVGSSASLAGSGMAFTTDFFRTFLHRNDVQGAGFDKVLQMEILNSGLRIAFAEMAIVYDEKTSKPGQLVNQRARWINTWFKYAAKGVKLMLNGLAKLNWNQFLCGLVFARPPLFITIGLSGFCIIANFFLTPYMLYFWSFALISFFFIFFVALRYFNAQKVIYSALYQIPVFIFYQVISLLRAKGANERSTATIHYHERNISIEEKTSESP